MNARLVRQNKPSVGLGQPQSVKNALRGSGIASHRIRADDHRNTKSQSPNQSRSHDDFHHWNKHISAKPGFCVPAPTVRILERIHRAVRGAKFNASGFPPPGNSPKGTVLPSSKPICPLTMWSVPFTRSHNFAELTLTG